MCFELLYIGVSWETHIWELHFKDIDLTTVFYTHLDVYKRQLLNFLPRSDSLSGPNMWKSDGAKSGPVSYTHLDVYKRQS